MSKGVKIKRRGWEGFQHIIQEEKVRGKLYTGGWRATFKTNKTVIHGIAIDVLEFTRRKSPAWKKACQNAQGY